MRAFGVPVGDDVGVRRGGGPYGPLWTPEGGHLFRGFLHMYHEIELFHAVAGPFGASQMPNVLHLLHLHTRLA